MPEQPEKLDLTSMDVTEDKKQKLKQLFPEVFREDEIDFDHLKRVLGEWVPENGRERFGLQWPGKAECMKIIQQPSIATLKPDREESVNFDDTENLFIEGDNLEVLKLLQKSYFGKVKMIYIDPPYNTGNDFIFPDDYGENLNTYLKYTDQKDEEGNWKTSNRETEGRYHSKWLNMMYPRLFIARNLLREDGVIFISIDDNEVHNLKSLCNDVLGEENFLGTLVWKNSTDNNPTNIATEHEYIHVYAKDKSDLEGVWKSHISDVKEKLNKISNELIQKYSDPDKRQQAYTKWFKQHKDYLWPLDRYKYIDEGGIYTGSQSVHNPGKEGYRYDVIHPETGKPTKQPLMGYRFPKETMDQLIDEGKVIFGEDESKIVELKLYAKEFKEKLSSVIELDGRLGAYDLRKLFPNSKKTFTNPKPNRLLTHLLAFVVQDDDIVIDFFAGSGSTAHAVFDLNNRDGRNRKFILVQLPEPIEKNNFPTIADIGKERIRRVINKIKDGREGQSVENQIEMELEEEPDLELDLGFKVFKLDRSNFKVWDSPDVDIDPEKLEEQLDVFSDHISPEAEQESILYELILKSGYSLSTSIEEKEIDGKTIYSIQDDELFIYLDEDLTFEILEKMAEMEPNRVVCLDKSFNGEQADALKTNAVQLFKSQDIAFRTV